MSGTALPGQRAAQQPMRAAVASQRAVGRAVAATNVLSDTLILNVGGAWRRLAVEDGDERLVPYELGDADQA